MVGQLLSTLGAKLTMVAVAYQVYALTRSSLAVGLVSLAQVLPLIAGALLGGSLAEVADRRRVLLVAVFPALATTVFGGGPARSGFFTLRPGPVPCSARSPQGGSAGSGGRGAQ